MDKTDERSAPTEIRRALDEGERRDLAQLMSLSDEFARDRSRATWIDMNAVAAKYDAPGRDAILSLFGLDANAGADVDLGGGG